MKKADISIEVLDFEAHVETELQEDSMWYYYKAIKGDRIIESFIILEEMLSTEVIRNSIEEKISNTEFIDIKEVSEDLRSLIEDCHSSENEMYFVEYSEVSEWTDERINRVQEEVLDLNIDNYIRFGEDGCLITVYGGISEVVNFNFQREKKGNR